MDVAASFAVELYDAPHSAWVDVTAWVKAGTLEIEKELNSRGTLSLELHDSPGSPVALAPTESMRIRVKDDTYTHFGGTVDTAVKNYADNDTSCIDYAVAALDYSRLLSRFPVNNVYTDRYAGDIVKAIISKIPGAEAIDVTNVEQGPKIAKATFPNLTVQEAIDEIARVAMFKWYVDADKKVYFFEPRAGALAATWNIDTAAINAGRFVEGAPKVTRETAQYRNLQEVIGGTTVDDNYSYYPTRTQSGIAGTYEPGKTAFADIVRKWSIGKPVNLVARVIICDSPTYNEDSAAIPLKVASQPGAGAFYYKQGEPYLYLSEEWTDYAGVEQSIEQYAPRKGQYMWIKYKSQTSVSSRIEKTEEWCNSEGLAVEDTIYDMAQIEGGSGIYKAVEINDNLKTVKECYERARALMIQFGKVPTIVNYSSQNWSDLCPGKFQELELYGYTNKLCTCTKMSIRDIDGVILQADFELVGSESFSGLAYFKSIAGGQTARMQSYYQIRADEIVIEHIGFQETLEVSDALTIADVAYATAKAWGTARFNDGGIWG